MADDGWDSGGESSRPVTVHSATFSRGGRRQNRGYQGAGARNDRRNNGGDDSWGTYGGERNSNGGRARYNEDKGFRGRSGGGGGPRGRGRGRGSGGYGKGTREEGSTTSLSVNSSDVGRIIGKGGSKIRELEYDSGAEIKIEKNNNYSDQTQVTLRGSPECQSKAKELIEELLVDFENKIGGGRSRGGKKGNTQEISNEYTSFAEELANFPPPVIDWDEVNRIYEEAQRTRWDNAPKLIKEFYQEDPQIRDMDPEAVAKFRKEKNNIVVSYTFGECDEKIPNPVITFEQAFSPYPDILELIYNQNFTEPSPIQCQSWPILLSGKDMIGISQTGSGKTLAFLLPALIHIEGQPVPRSERGGPNVLILAPTRELAQQIENEANKYSYRNIKSICIYGGGCRYEQISALKRGVEIVVATPGRMNDLISTGDLKLDSITYLVLDEADRMLDMGFEPEIRKTIVDLRPNKQVVMTSATWPPGVRRLAQSYMSNPVQVYIGSLDLAATHSVTQIVQIVNEDEKEAMLQDFFLNMAPEDKVMVFMGKKCRVDDISSELSLNGINCDVIHGGRAQCDRESALIDFRSGETRILLATDVASRGIDVQDITHIINYDFPRNIEEYVHRVGRTGRAGKTGEAITYVTREDWAQARDLISLLEEANQVVPEELYKMADRFDAMKERKDQERKDGGGGGGKRFGRGRRW